MPLPRRKLRRSTTSLGLDAVLDSLSQSLDRMTEGKAVKGDPLDLNVSWRRCFSLEQMTNNVVTSQEISEDSGDQRVDALAKRVKNYLDSVAREAHALASELGPLPRRELLGADTACGVLRPTRL
jgi:hypothetical protein